MKSPLLVAAADWSVDGRKRHLARAAWNPKTQHYEIHASEEVGDTSMLIDRLRDGLPSGATVILGFDLPIGLPKPYANTAGITSFLDFLPRIGADRWARFATHTNTPTLDQPFAPLRVRKKGDFTRQDLVDGLGLSSFDDIQRRCDRLAKAQPLFLTVGGKQVGRAALHAWQHVLIPNLDRLRIWPFHGSLAELIAEPGATVIVEVYPGGAYAQLGMELGRQQRGGKRRSKTRREDRQHPDVGGRLLAALEGVGQVTQEARAEILSGFDSDDAFDAMVGLAALLMGTTGRWKDETPTDDAVRNVEGWIWRL